MTVFFVRRCFGLLWHSILLLFGNGFMTRCKNPFCPLLVAPPINLVQENSFFASGDEGEGGSGAKKDAGV